MVHKQINGKTAWTNAVFTKTFRSTREILFQAWTDEQQVAAWWGPFGFTNPVCRWNARYKGEIYIEMMSPDGMLFPLKGFFHEVIAPEQLIFVTRAFEDESGNVQVEVLASVIFTEVNGKTKLTIEATVMKSSPNVYCFLETMYEGWKQSLEKLEKFLLKNK
jgi:uncharacterized protein YndB with AHSA1/START domain